MTRSYRSALALTALAALGLAAARPTTAQSLTGQPVQVTYLYPNKSTVGLDDGTKTITPGGTVFSDVFENITVTPAQVTFTFTNTATNFYSSSFNGFQIAETGAAPVGIAGVTLDPSSNLTGFDASRISFDSKDVFANFQGLGYTPSSKVTLNLSFAPAGPPAVPEPSQTLAFACGALGLVGIVVAKRRRKQAAPGL